MQNALEKLIRVSQRDERSIFWIFWAFFLPSVFVDLPKTAPPPEKETFIIVGIWLSGFVVWRILQIKKLSPLKDVLIGLQGFLILMLMGPLFLALFALLFSWMPAEGMPQWVLLLSAVFAFPVLAIVFFLAGCWLGFKVEKPVLLIVTWSFFLAALVWKAQGLSFVIFLFLIPFLIGTYVGNSRLSCRGT